MYQRSAANQFSPSYLRANWLSIAKPAYGGSGFAGSDAAPEQL